MPEHTTGWLAGLRDRFVGRALALLHERPSAPWTIDDLSSQVGLSRSALHERFVSLVGQPPVQYLTNWRMQLASRKLLEGRSSVATVALDVGYDSEAAFARAFKRLVGMPPAAWRRAQESSPAARGALMPRPRALPLAALCAVLGLAGATVATADEITISIVGTNDLHGRLFTDDQGRGGLTVLGGFIDNLRAARAADGGAVLVLDAGDTFQGGIESNLSEGLMVVDAYNAIGYTALAIGNHDFDYGSVDPRAPVAEWLPKAHRTPPSRATCKARSRPPPRAPASRFSRRTSSTRRRASPCDGRTSCRPRSSSSPVCASA